MTNPTNTAKYPAAAAEILAAAEQAAESWDGITWDSAPQTLLAAVEAGRSIGTDDLTEGCYWPDNGSYAAQELARDWSALVTEVTGDDEQGLGRPVEYDTEVVAEAQRLAEAEAAAVEERAAAAAELGRQAAELVGAGHWSEAVEAAEEAAGIEREFGDAPAWGGLAAAIRALPEYLAAEQASEDYQSDDRSDEEIAAANTEAQAVERCGGAISAIGERKLGLAADTRDEWCARYVAAYRAEITEWCAL